MLVRQYLGNLQYYGNRSVTVFLLCLLMCLGGCTAVPDRSLSPVDLPDSFSTTGEDRLKSNWWSAFNDNTLNAFVEQALSNNFSLLAIRERLFQAQAVARQAGAPLIPSIDGDGLASTTRNYQSGDNSDSFSLGFSASFEVDLWGRLRNIQEAALLELGATKADIATAELSLAAEVALTWLSLVENEQQLKLLSTQKETNEKVLEVITIQFRSGKTDISDVLQQRQLIESNRASITGLKGDKRVLEHQLTLLLGKLPEKRNEDISGDLPDLPPLPETGIPLILLARRPDVQASFIRLQAADQRSAAAVANRFPRLSLSASLTTSGPNTRDLFSDWFSRLSANLIAPIVDGGFLEAEVEKTQSIAREQLNSYSQTVLEAMSEIENSLVREEELLQALESEKLQLQLAAETVVHVGNRYRQGAEDYQRVLLALISRQNLQRSIVAIRLALLENRIALYRALSGPVDPQTISNDTTEGKL